VLRLRRRQSQHHLAAVAAAVFVATAFVAMGSIMVSRTTALREQLGRAESMVKQLQSELRKQQETQDHRLDGLERQLARGARDGAAAAGKRGRGGEKTVVREGDGRAK
jgi:hypothetical protein